MKYLLDTNAVIDFLRGHPVLKTRVAGAAGIVTSSVVAAELYVGYHATLGSKTPAAKAEVAKLFKDYRALDFDAADGKETGRLIVQFGLVKERAIYRDVMIAAQAKKRGLTVVTNNTGDFFRIVGLSVENWTI